MQGPNPGLVPTPGAPDIPALIPFLGLPNLPGRGIQPINLPLAPGVSIPPTHDVPGGFHTVKETDLANDVPGGTGQSNGPFPAGFQALVDDPNSLLRDTIAGQDILGFIAINLSTADPGSDIGNIPFLGLASSTPGEPYDPNAFVYSVNATFWIEWVRIPHEHHPHHPHGGLWRRHEERHDPSYEIEPFLDEPTYLQLQYSQLVILIFNGVLWPHITVATLTLSSG